MSDHLIDEVSQKLFISSMLGNATLFSRVQHLLEPSYFDGSLKDAVTFMKKYFHEQRSVPALPIMLAATKVNIEPTHNLSNGDVQFLAEQIAAFCQIRAVTEAVLRAPSHIEKGNFGLMVSEIKMASQIALHTDLGIEYFQDPSVRLEANEELEQLISTGWYSVDELIGGGVGRQELVLYTANSGGGKSAAMLNMANNLLKRGLHGVYISLEMRDRVVAKRLDSMISKINGKFINANKLKVGQDVELARDSGYGRFFIKRMREGSTTADHIISYLRELEAVHGFKPDFVVVDYIDLMASVQKHGGDSLFTKDKFVTEEVRAIGFDFNCLMISASQLGRSAIEASREQKPLDQAHIQGGISKINTSDLVIALVKTEDMDKAGEYRFEFLKSRNSNAVNKKLNMKWDSDSLCISDADTLQLKPTAAIRPKMSMSVSTPGKTGDGLQDLLNNR